MARPGIEPRSSCSANQELNHSATAAPSPPTRIPLGTLDIVLREVLWSIRRSYSAIWSLPLTNVKWHSDPWPVTVTSQLIRLSTNFMTLIPSLSFTELWVVYMEHLQRVWHASRERLTPLHTWFRPPFRDLVKLQLLRPVFLIMPCLYSTFHLGISISTEEGDEFQYIFIQTLYNKCFCENVFDRRNCRDLVWYFFHTTIY